MRNGILTTCIIFSSNYLSSLPEEPQAPVESYSFQIIQPPPGILARSFGNSLSKATESMDFCLKEFNSSNFGGVGS